MLLRVCVIALCVLGPSLAHASPGSPVPSRAAAPAKAVRVSGPSPLPSVEKCSRPLEQSTTPAPEHESEPVVAVDPLDARHVVAAWAQGGDRAIVTAVSTNGGATWSRPAAVPGLSSCTGGEFPYVTHPHLSFGIDPVTGQAVVYLAAFARHLPSGVRAQTLVSRSTDGGAHWTLTARPDLPVLDVANDFDSFTVEPDTGALLVVGSVMELNVVSETTLLSRSADGGRTWTRVLVRTAAPGSLSWSTLLALPDGRLLLAYFDSPLSEFVVDAGTPVDLQVVLSEDKGASWSSPRTIGAGTTLQWPRADVASDGTLHIAWVRSAPGGTCRGQEGGQCEIAVSSSGADATSWSPPRSLESWDGPWMPSPGVAARPGKVVTVVHTHPDPGGRTARALLSTSARGGEWEDVDAGAVDLSADTGVSAGLGLVQGADAVSCSIVGAAVRTEGAEYGSSDVFVVGYLHGASGCTR